MRTRQTKNIAKRFDFLFLFCQLVFQQRLKREREFTKRTSLSFHVERGVLIDAKILQRADERRFVFWRALFIFFSGEVPSSPYRTKTKFLHVSAAAVRRRYFEREPSSVTGNGQK